MAKFRRDYFLASILRTKARDVAQQLSVYFRMHPDQSIAEMRRDPLFMDLAVQTVGKTGYTALSEAADTYRIRAHPNPALVDRQPWGRWRRS